MLGYCIVRCSKHLVKSITNFYIEAKIFVYFKTVFFLINNHWVIKYTIFKKSWIFVFCKRILSLLYCKVIYLSEVAY